MPGSFSKLYHDCCHAQWWDELLDLGPLTPGSPEWEDAYDVAQQTATLARQNVEVIVEFLSHNDYHFGFGSGSTFQPNPNPWTLPSSETRSKIRRLEETAGAVPLSIRAWWEIVRDVCLQGRFQDDSDTPHADIPLMDELFVLPVDYVLKDLDDWLQDEEKVEPFEAPISPDILHKGEYSGGPHYSIELPDARADGQLKNIFVMLDGPLEKASSWIRTRDTFSSYMRRTLEWGGFLGLATSRTNTEKYIRRLGPLFKKVVEI